VHFTDLTTAQAPWISGAREDGACSSQYNVSCCNKLPLEVSDVIQYFISHSQVF
jgi:hypothetical protein